MSAHWLYRNPFKILPGILVMIGFFCFQIPNISIDTSSEKLLHKDDPSLLEYNRFREQFGRAEFIVIAVESSELFEESFLRRLKSFHEELENEVPYLKRVTSLINVRHTFANADELMVKDLLENWPDKPVNLLNLKQQVLRNPYYLNYIISEEGRVTGLVIETLVTVEETLGEKQILAEFEDDSAESQISSQSKNYFSGKENREVVETVARIVDRYHSDSFRLTASGRPVVIDAFNRETLEDVILFISLSLLAIAIFLGAFFRRISGLIFPMLIINSTLVSTFGLMAYFGVPIKLTTAALPAFLVVVGVCDAVHVLAIFYSRFDQGENKAEAVANAFKHSGLAIVLTSLTTIAALLSFSFAELSAITDIGYFAAAGVLLALIFTFIILPALLALTPLKRIRKTGRKQAFLDKVLRAVGDLTTNRPRMIIIISFGIFALFLPAVFRLEFSHNIVEYFPDYMPYKSDLKYVDRELNGTLTLEIVLDTGRDNGIHEPWVLNRIEEIGPRIGKINRDDISVGKVFSITDILKEIHRALNENNKSFFRIPQQRDVISQEFLLFENSGADDLQSIADSQFRKTRVTVKTSWADAVVCRNFIRDINFQLRDVFKDQIDIRITGLFALLARTISAAIYSMAKSYFIALVLITLIMILLSGSMKIGLLSVVPNLIPVLITMGIMGFMNVPLDINSLLIGSIALGIVVDDTLHFMYNFQKFYDNRGDPSYAVKQTLLGVGRPLLITSLVLSTGFFIMTCSSLRHLLNFGFYTGVTILIALLADFVLLPAILVKVNSRQAVNIDPNKSLLG